MANYVRHRIEFNAESAKQVFSSVLDEEGTIDFNRLVPQPPNIYFGDISGEDEEDFQINWDSWRRENWGTKWGAAYGKAFVECGCAVIEFCTAWTVPYPILAAFNNLFPDMQFTHTYHDEMDNFWGHEEWGVPAHRNTTRVQRISKRFSNKQDLDVIKIILYGEAE